jgi:hypothetical protein
MLPEKNHPAWGTMPPVKILSEMVSVPYSFRNPWISFSHAEALPGYQLPEKMDFLTFITAASFLTYQFATLGGISPIYFYLN